MRGTAWSTMLGHRFRARPTAALAAAFLFEHALDSLGEGGTPSPSRFSEKGAQPDREVLSNVVDPALT